jgi:hypothetical protein
MLLLIGSRQVGWLAIVRAQWRRGRKIQKGPAWSKRAQNWLTRGDCFASQIVCGRRRPPSALRNGRGRALTEQFGSVTRRFPWSVIVIEALSPMVLIHTRWIIMVPAHQHLLGFLAPLFESHRRLVWVMDRPVGDRSPGFFFAYGKSQHFDLGQELFNLRSSSCHVRQRNNGDSGHANPR